MACPPQSSRLFRTCVWPESYAPGNTGSGSASRRATCAAFLGFSFAISAMLMAVPASFADQSEPTEYQVKAAYLYNFGKFVAWPDAAAAEPDSSFEICVLGEDPFGSALNSTVAGETIHGYQVVAKRITKPQEIDDCRILFISNSEMSRLAEIVTLLDKTSVLTVSDIPQFSQHGGMIQFVVDRNRVRFEINVTNAEHAGLTVSSALLKVAARVTGTPHHGF